MQITTKMAKYIRQRFVTIAEFTVKSRHQQSSQNIGPKTPIVNNRALLFCTIYISNSKINNDKALREAQTLRAGCSKAEPKKIRPAADPLLGGRMKAKI